MGKYSTVWRQINRYIFIDVIPINDVIEHGAGDECPCGPTVTRGSDYLPLITHKVMRVKISKEDRNGSNDVK